MVHTLKGANFATLDGKVIKETLNILPKVSVLVTLCPVTKENELLGSAHSGYCSL